MKLLLSFILLALLTLESVASHSNAGLVAAREMGLTNYVEFKNNGKPDTAAMFYWRGNWWVYHPSIGSMRTALDDPDTVPLVAALAIKGATGPFVWRKMDSKTRFLRADLPNGCLPRAVAEVRKHGGGIFVTTNHAQAVR
jgi:hypothetical protein